MDTKSSRTDPDAHELLPVLLKKASLVKEMDDAHAELVSRHDDEVEVWTKTNNGS